MFDHKPHRLFLVSHTKSKREIFIICHSWPHSTSIFKSTLTPFHSLFHTRQISPGKNEGISSSQIKNSVLESQPDPGKSACFLSTIHKVLRACLPPSPRELAAALPRAWFSCIVFDLQVWVSAHSFTNIFTDFQNYTDITFLDRRVRGSPRKLVSFWYLEINTFVLNCLIYSVI